MTTNALPPTALLYRLAIGHYLSRALHVMASLGIADLLRDGACDCTSLARASGTNPAALRRLLRLLVSAGLLNELDSGAFKLTDLGSGLRSDVPGSARALVMLFAGPGIQDMWKDLEFCVRTGEPAFRKHRADGDAFTTMDVEETKVFDAAMATFAPQTAAAVLSAYDFSALRTLVDVGGGNGALLVSILRANPKLVGTVLDRSQVAEGAGAIIASAGLAARCSFAAGDFFEAVPSGADAYLLKHVIHDWDDAQALRILEVCRRAMRPDSKLLVIEGVYPERIDDSFASRGAAANDVNMLVATGGRQRSAQEFRELYQAAGFTLTRIVATPFVSVIEGAPAG